MKLLAALFLLLSVPSFAGEWVHYVRIAPVRIYCSSEANALLAARSYCAAVGGSEVARVPPSFSMSRTFRTGDVYVIERVPFAEAGGRPGVYWKSLVHGDRVLHYFIARDVLGRYVAEGDGPRNVGHYDDVRVTPQAYFGVVKRVFDYPR